MAFVDRTHQSAPKGVETYRTASGRVMVEPAGGSNLKRGEVRKIVKQIRESRSDADGSRSR